MGLTGEPSKLTLLPQHQLLSLPSFGASSGPKAAPVPGLQPPGPALAAGPTGILCSPACLTPLPWVPQALACPLAITVQPFLQGSQRLP